MHKHILYTVLLTGSLLTGPSWAEEPHSSDAHRDLESVYASGPLLTLDDAITRAMDASPRLRSAVAGYDAAKGTEQQAGNWLNPEIAIEAENLAGSGTYSGTRSAEYTYGLSQTIEIGGKRGARSDAALAAREAAGNDMLTARQDLARDVQVAYAEAMAESEAMKLAAQQEQLAADVLTAVSRRVDAAAEPEIQRSKAQVAHATSIIARQQQERQLRIAKDKLARLWGEQQLNASLDHAWFFNLENPETLEHYQQALTASPNLQQLVHKQAEKEAWLAYEKAQAIPDPSVSLGMRDFRDSGDQAFVLGVSLPIPVLNQNRGNIARARAELSQSESDAEQTKLALEQELTENWQHWRTAYTEAEQLKTDLLPTAEKAFSLARSGYERGKFPYLEVLDAQRTLFDAYSQYYDALKRYHTARANVQRLTRTTGEAS